VTARELAPAKLNLSLFLGGPRPDGRHELVTLLESISLFDELELAVRSDGAADEVVCAGVEGPNLVDAALRELRSRGWAAPPVRIEIAKRIPVAAGLGGGSADAAAALRLAGRLAPVDDELVREIAAGLGADVPSQLRPGVCLGTGAGDEVTPRDPLPEHAFLVLPQPVMLSTADVYREADRLGLPRPGDELAGLRARLKDGLEPSLMVNDLQPAAISLCPQIAGALSAAQSSGADQVMVSGSGPTVFGVFWGDAALGRAEQAASQIQGGVVAQPVSSWPYGTI
jgi:4-diphosphocytidyl-2-C-methyl-D-erythritol kinase